MVPGGGVAPSGHGGGAVEEVLVVFLQFFFEIVMEIVVYVGLDWGWSRGSDRDGCFYVLVFMLMGGLLGAVMNWVHPGLLTPWPAARVAGLIIWPIVAGSVSWLVASALAKRGQALNARMHFWSAFLFVLGFNLVRFMFGAR
jgi:hypothetical protein